MRVQVLRMLLGLAALAIVLYGAATVLAPFARPLIWAVIFGTATWPAYRRVVNRVGEKRRNVAALAMTVLLILVVLIPTALMATAMVAELEPEAERLRAWASDPKLDLPAWIDRYPPLADPLRELIEGLTDREQREEMLRQMATQSEQLTRLGRNVAQHALELVLTVFALFFVYRDGETVAREIRLILDRIAAGRGQHLLQAVRETVKAVFFGWLMTAAAQGLISIPGYWIAGVRTPVLLGILTGFAAVIPFGVGLILVPTIIGVALSGSIWQAVFLAAWGFGIVSLIDNFLRPLFISGPANIPFVLVFFGVLGGLATYGLIGLVLGPVFLAVLLALWRQSGDVFLESASEAPESTDSS